MSIVNHYRYQEYKVEIPTHSIPSLFFVTSDQFPLHRICHSIECIAHQPVMDFLSTQHNLLLTIAEKPFLHS